MIWLKKHWLFILGMVIVGAFSIAPQFLFVRHLGDNYQGIYLSDTSDELYYHSRVQEIFDGHPGIGNSYLWEQKSDPFLQPPLGEWLVYGLGRLTGLSQAGLAVFAYKLFFPVLVFILLFYFCRQLISNKYLAWLAALVIIVASNLFFNPADLWHWLWGSGFTNVIQAYSRPINPQVSSAFFCCYLLVLYLSLKLPAKKFWFYLAGLFFGAAFYVYPYTWIFILALNGILILLFWKNFRQLSWQVLKIALIGLLLSIPYWLMVFRATQSEAFMFAASNYTLRLTHELIISKIVLLSWLLMAVIVWLRRGIFRQLSGVFLVGLNLASLAVINQQVITGRELFHGHFHTYYNIPVLVITAFYLFNELRTRLNRSRTQKAVYRSAVALIVLVLAVNIWLTLSNITQVTFAKYAPRQEYGAVVKWIEANAQADDVFLATDLELANLLPAYTSANVFTAFPATFFLAPQSRIQFDYFVYLRLKGIEPTEEVFRQYYASRVQEALGIGGVAFAGEDHNCLECFTDEARNELLSRYQEFYSQDYSVQLSKYRLDYIIVRRGEEGLISGEWADLATPEVGNFAIYKVK